jgi:Family of unknown function (DUF5651)
MARYFTKHDRENIIKLSTVEGTLKIMIHEMAEHERPAAWLKALRMAHTWAGKANQLMADDCSDDELKKLWRYFDQYELKMLPGHEAKRIREQEDLTTVSKEGLNDMAEAVLTVKCDGCTIEHHKSCRFRDALMGAGVPAWDHETPDDQCQYKY